MRYGVALGVLVALLVVVPASARQHDEDVTLRAGEAVRLTTFFSKDRPYLVTVSGVVTLTVSNTPITIDPLFSYSGNCQNPSSRVGVRLIDSRGIDVFSPFSAVPAPKCRSDHTYTFRLNGPTPRTGVLGGRLTAKNDITVITARGDSASGSFKLTIEAEPPEPAAVVRFSVNANEKRNVVGSARLNGRGVMEAPEIREGGFADRARLVPVTTVTGVTPELTYVREGLRRQRVVVEATSGVLIMQGAAGSADERFSISLIVEVVASNIRSCPAQANTRRGARGKIALVDYPRGGKRGGLANALLDLPCGGVDESWVSPDSEVGIVVTKLRKKA